MKDKKARADLSDQEICPRLSISMEKYDEIVFENHPIC